MGISRCCFAEDGTDLFIIACRKRTTLVFPHSTNQILNSWRCRYRNPGSLIFLWKKAYQKSQIERECHLKDNDRFNLSPVFCFLPFVFFNTEYLNLNLESTDCVLILVYRTWSTGVFVLKLSFRCRACSRYWKSISWSPNPFFYSLKFQSLPKWCGRAECRRTSPSESNAYSLRVCWNGIWCACTAIRSTDGWDR